MHHSPLVPGIVTTPTSKRRFLYTYLGVYKTSVSNSTVYPEELNTSACKRLVDFKYDLNVYEERVRMNENPKETPAKVCVQVFN